MKAAKKKSAPQQPLVSGHFSKKEGAQKIATGIAHVHSAILGERDTYARLTADALKEGKIPSFPWEKTGDVLTASVSTSAERYQLATTIMNEPLVSGRRKVRERLEVVLEELLTNALYHAYRNDKGEEKYPRKLPVQLADREKLIVKYSISKEGVYLSVTDQGGTLRFSDISAAFARTYGAASPEIQGKEGGAGLGIFMVFESTAHYKAVCRPGKSCEVSVWISDKRGDDKDPFSFNFFSVEE